MSCGNCVQEVAPAISPQRVSAPATGGKERDGYPFSLASLLGPDYLRLDFTTTSKEPLESNDTLLWLNRGLGW